MQRMQGTAERMQFAPSVAAEIGIFSLPANAAARLTADN